MTMEIGGRTFEFQLASDIIRDGLGFEAWELTDGSKTLVLEVFRQDPEGSLSVMVEAVSLPFELYEYIVAITREELLPEGWSPVAEWETEE